MARGMAAGERIVSQAATDEFREGHVRTFGERKPQRGRWVWDPEKKCCVDAASYRPPEKAKDAPIRVDRFMEGDRAPDGTDIGSRTKRKAWMTATGVADYDDFKGARAKRSAELAARRRGEFKKDPALREHLGRELYKAKIII